MLEKEETLSQVAVFLTISPSGHQVAKLAVTHHNVWWNIVQCKWLPQVAAVTVPGIFNLSLVYTVLTFGVWLGLILTAVKICTEHRAQTARKEPAFFSSM